MFPEKKIYLLYLPLSGGIYHYEVFPMVYVTVTYFVKEENHEEFFKAAQPLIEKTRQEPGCIFYELVKSEDHKDNLYFVEKWESRWHSRVQHCQSDHVKEYGPNLAKLTYQDGFPLVMDVPES